MQTASQQTLFGMLSIVRFEVAQCSSKFFAESNYSYSTLLISDDRQLLNLPKRFLFFYEWKQHYIWLDLVRAPENPPPSSAAIGKYKWKDKGTIDSFKPYNWWEFSRCQAAYTVMSNGFSSRISPLVIEIQLPWLHGGVLLQAELS